MKKTLLLFSLLISNFITNAQDAINTNTSKSRYEFYLGYGHSNFKTRPTEYSRSVFTINTSEIQLGDTLTNYREKYNINHHFKNKHTFAAGIKKYEPLIERLNLYYGAGLQLMQFSYDPTIDTTTEISQKLVLIEKANGKNTFKVIFSDNNSLILNQSTISKADKTTLIRMQLELGMEYEITKSLSLSLGGTLYSPLVASLKGIANSSIFIIDENGNLIQQSSDVTSKSTTAFTAYQINVHVGILYQIHQKLRLYGQFSLPSYKSLIDVSEMDGNNSAYFKANDVRASHFIFGIQMQL